MRFVVEAAGATFINLDISVILDKWYGESQKLASAVFTLAAKLQVSSLCLISSLADTFDVSSRR